MPQIKVDWSKFDHLLGVEQDKELAVIAGCTENNVNHRRRKLGIPSSTTRATWSNDDQKLLLDNMLKCVTCLQNKDINQFHCEKGTRIGCRRTCKGCFADMKKDKWKCLKSKYTSLLGGACIVCNFNKFLGSLQFHHVEDNKSFEVSRKMYGECNEELIRSEIDKCCLLCSNCHDAYHSGELNLQFKKSIIGWTAKEVK